MFNTYLLEGDKASKKAVKESYSTDLISPIVLL